MRVTEHQLEERESVERDEEHPYMPNPVRANQVTTTTPADSVKKAGANEGRPVNLN